MLREGADRLNGVSRLRMRTSRASPKSQPSASVDDAEPGANERTFRISPPSQFCAFALTARARFAGRLD